MAKKPQNIQKRIKDPVSEMKIYRQGLQKQARHQIFYDDFKVNHPSKMTMFTQKPNNNPFLLMKLKSEGKNINGIDLDEKLQTSLNKTQLSPEVDQQLKTALKVPKDKWTVPQTSNQQFGWFSDKARSKSHFTYERNKCNQTNYADSYYSMMHASLFSNHKKK